MPTMIHLRQPYNWVLKGRWQIAQRRSVARFPHNTLLLYAEVERMTVIDEHSFFDLHTDVRDSKSETKVRLKSDITTIYMYLALKLLLKDKFGVKCTWSVLKDVTEYKYPPPFTPLNI